MGNFIIVLIYMKSTVNMNNCAIFVHLILDIVMVMAVPSLYCCKNIREIFSNLMLERYLGGGSDSRKIQEVQLRVSVF